MLYFLCEENEGEEEADEKRKMSERVVVATR